MLKPVRTWLLTMPCLSHTIFLLLVRFGTSQSNLGPCLRHVVFCKGSWDTLWLRASAQRSLGSFQALLWPLLGNIPPSFPTQSPIPQAASGFRCGNIFTQKAMQRTNLEYPQAWAYAMVALQGKSHWPISSFCVCVLSRHCGLSNTYMSGLQFPLLTILRAVFCLQHWMVYKAFSTWWNASITSEDNKCYYHT